MCVCVYVCIIVFLNRKYNYIVSTFMFEFALVLQRSESSIGFFFLNLLVFFFTNKYYVFINLFKYTFHEPYTSCFLNINYYKGKHLVTYIITFHFNNYQLKGTF